VHAIGAGEFCQRRLAVKHQPRAVLSRHRQQTAQQQNLFVFGQIFFPYAHPAAAARQRLADDLSQRAPRLGAVGHQQ
jgi:hypothetical protein